MFSIKEGFSDLPVEVPCGQCIGCRLERSKQWAIRCYHEASLYEENAFVTLTYNDDCLPWGGTLVKSDYQKFLKRLRSRHLGRKIRYYMCGEYGEESSRPHYHLCLFNFDFADKQLYSIREGVRLYVSDELAELWPLGFSSTGDVTFESAAYVARYIMKKVTGDQAEEHYKSVDPRTGEIFDILPEFTNMSRESGIGKGWFERYGSDVYPSDQVVIQGKVHKPPRFYDGLYEAQTPDYLRLKRDRKVAAMSHAEDQTRERLDVREKVKQAQVKQLKRTL